MDYKFFCNTEIAFVNSKSLEKRLLSLEAENILLLMSDSMSKRANIMPFITELKAHLKARKGKLIWVNKIPYNPTTIEIIQILKQIGKDQIDVIVAIGGGSAIDLGKAISAFHYKNIDSLDSLDEIKYSIKQKSYMGNRFIDIIAVPSTAGTGSELTQWATIWDENKNNKLSIDAPGLKPKLALINPEFTIAMKAELTLAAGLDALSQAVESYWSKHTTPIVQEIAYRAIEIITKNLRKAIDCPRDLEIRNNLCKASVLSGLAFSQTRTTACHSISYPLTMLFDIPHGIAAAITLDAVGKINKGHFPNDMALFKLFEVYGGIGKYIDEVCRGTINMRLSSFGITEGDIPEIVGRAFTGGRMDNNPVDLSVNDVSNILKAIL